MVKTKYLTKVIMDNGKVYGFNESLDIFLKRIYDNRTSRIIPTLLKGKDFYLNTEHIASIEEIQELVEDEKLPSWEIEKMSFELRKLLEEDCE
ncbi:hypothetical protein [Clostridium thermarum]|uniref:hypothetical protein n=1 Tax=Clostridium thermarum TaxID=1716543 RepID=UPI00111EA4D1|nr:hypothetical protein [Clostridium thermarum]